MDELDDLLRARVSRRTFVRGLSLAGLSAASTALWVQSAAAAQLPPLTRCVAFGDDPLTQATVSFSAKGPFRRAVVEYGPDDALGGRVEAEVQSVPGAAALYGRAPLIGLAPGTRYSYRVLIDGTASGPRTLSTAPARPGAFTFTAFGDQGVSAGARAVMAQVARVRPSFHLLTGDMCYADTTGSGGFSDVLDVSVWDRWLTLIDPVASGSPWMCATGNHDMEPGFGPQGYSGYLRRFAVPTTGAPGCPTTYSFVYGNVGVICLDANDVSYELPHNLDYSGGRQTTWLAQRLAAFRAPGSPVEFIVVFFHHCVYSTSESHGAEGGVRDHWVPLFDLHSVDLVLNGHAHVYERTAPLRAGAVTQPAERAPVLDSRLGTTYVTAGGGGQTSKGGFVAAGKALYVQPDGSRRAESAPWSLSSKTTEHSFLAVDVTPETGDAPARMALRAVDANGRLLDQVTLQRVPVRRGESRFAGAWAVGGGLVVVGAGAGVAVRRRRASVPTAAGEASSAAEEQDA